MKQVIILFLISAILFSCTASKEYVYHVEMTKPKPSTTLEFENDTFHISFSLEPKYIEFTLYNKSNDGLKFSWDEVAISINGKSYRVVHKETGMYKVNDVQPPTTVPPQSNIKDFLLPTDNIRYAPSGNSARTITMFTDLFPTMDYGNKKKKAAILGQIGSRITIFLPYYIKGQYVSQSYDLLIKNIYPKK